MDHIEFRIAMLKAELLICKPEFKESIKNAIAQLEKHL